MSSKQQARQGWRNVHLILQHTDRSILAADLSDVMETLELDEWREEWSFLDSEQVWQVTVINSWTKDA